MGSAIADRLRGQHEVLLVDRDDDKLSAVADANAVLIAVKPQSLPDVASELGDSLRESLVLSILAGTSLQTLSEKLECRRVVRTMPNLPVRHGKGVTGWIASDAVSSEDRQSVQEILSPLGVLMEVESEDQLNALTAISGSGPAYFFALCEHLAEAAQALGFSPAQSELLARQTLIGAGELLDNSTQTSGEWRAAVTSKGGTTAAALQVFEEGQLASLVGHAAQAAKARAEELSN